MKTWVIVIISILLGACGQLLLKFGVNNSRTEGLSSLTYIFNMFINQYVIFGILSYVLSLTLWLIALRYMSLSLLYPMVSLSYFFVALGSFIFLGESISTMRIFAISIIMIGVLLLAKS